MAICRKLRSGASSTSTVYSVAVAVGAVLVVVTLSSTIYDIAHTAYGGGGLLCDLAGR